MRFFLYTAFAISTLVQSAPATQPKPDFAGRWVAVEPAVAMGHELRIRQDADALTLDQPRLQVATTYDVFGRRVLAPKAGRERATYPLKGPGRVVPIEGGRIRLSTAWNAATLTLVDIYASYDSPDVRIERELSLDGTGRLVLEQKRPVASAFEPQIASQEISYPRRIVFVRY